MLTNQKLQRPIYGRPAHAWSKHCDPCEHVFGCAMPLSCAHGSKDQFTLWGDPEASCAEGAAKFFSSLHCAPRYCDESQQRIGASLEHKNERQVRWTHSPKRANFDSRFSSREAAKNAKDAKDAKESACLWHFRGFSIALPRLGIRERLFGGEIRTSSRLRCFA